MEAYFHSDPRIQEWVDQITEKIFTVCLLTGADSEVEFQKGCQIVKKLSHLLQGISIFPPDYLEDGLKQLVEQQLPDSRVINNFPTFQETMNKMLQEGMTRAIDLQSKENLIPLATAIEYYPENSSPETSEGTEEFVTELAIPALASVNLPSLNLRKANTELASSLVTSIPAKSYGIIRKTQAPEHTERLKQVLNNIFPNVTVSWNLTLMGQTFLAQVGDILICLDNPEQPCPVKNLNKEGWKVFLISANDLMFPRRLEREIRHLKRLGKQRVNSLNKG